MVDHGRVCIYSQVKNCSSSEVAAMIEGLLRQGTDAEIEANYTDTHGASVVGFAFTELLGFKLLPRLKNIGSIRLYSPDDGPATWPWLERVVKNRPIDWELIERNYDQMVKYATALRLGTAEAEQVLRRFTKGGGPKARSTSRSRSWGARCVRSSPATSWPPKNSGGRSTPGCRWWRTGTRPTRWSSTARTASSPARTGRPSRCPCSPCTCCRAASSTSTSCCCNGSWPIRCGPKRLTAEDRRALSALFWTHVNPYGRFQLDMTKRLDLDAVAA